MFADLFKTGTATNSGATQFLGLAGQVFAANAVYTAAQSQASTILQGGDVQSIGFGLQAAAYRQSKVAVQQATDFNLGINALNTHRQLKASAEQFQRVVGRQLLQQANTGLSLGSKTFLMQRNEAMDVYTRQLTNLKIDSENNRRAQVFQSNLKRVNLENQARAAEYSGQAARVNAANAATSARSKGSIAQIGSAFNVAQKLPSIINTFKGA